MSDAKEMRRSFTCSKKRKDDSDLRSTPRKKNVAEYNAEVDDDSDEESIEEGKYNKSFGSDSSKTLNNNSSSSSIENDIVTNTNMCEYEKLRLKNMEENKKMMLDLGLIDAKKEYEDYIYQIANTVKKEKEREPRKKSTRTPAPVTPLPLRPRSQRIQNKLSGTPAVPPVLLESPMGTPVEEYKQKIRNTEDVVSMAVEDHDEEGAWNDFLNNIRTHLDGESITTHTESTESVAKEMRQLCLATLKTKVVGKRIQSLCVHPVESKLLVAAGSIEGSLVFGDMTAVLSWPTRQSRGVKSLSGLMVLGSRRRSPVRSCRYCHHHQTKGLWDVSSDVKPLQFYPHISAVNCISVRSADYNQLLTTSHDGTIRCADLQKSVFNLVYQTDGKTKIKHITWHCEHSENTLLVAEGTGCVSLVDLRATDKCKPKMSIHCHERSVRTVQLHPVNKNYFVTSSGMGECKIFDMRNIKAEFSLLPHKKGLTSSFFSPDGSKVLTTSNDDRLRVFDVTALEHPKEECRILHDNHTGRWLSVFKAIWHPVSSDMFLIGSLQNPRRVQLYSTTGALLKEIKSDDMTTITPVLGIHPNQPIIAGGDSAGRVYIFSTQSYIDKYDLKL